VRHGRCRPVLREKFTNMPANDDGLLYLDIGDITPASIVSPHSHRPVSFTLVLFSNRKLQGYTGCCYYI
jgi:hypothetical protein